MLYYNCLYIHRYTLPIGKARVVPLEEYLI